MPPRRGCEVAGVGDAVIAIVDVAVTEWFALLVAVKWYVPVLVVYSATVHGSFTTHGLVPTIVPPSEDQVTVLSPAPVTTAVTVWYEPRGATGVWGYT
jgi:hypothetical protein